MSSAPILSFETSTAASSVAEDGAEGGCSPNVFFERSRPFLLSADGFARSAPICRTLAIISIISLHLFSQSTPLFGAYVDAPS